MKRVIYLALFCLVSIAAFGQKPHIIHTKKIQLTHKNQRDSLLMPIASPKYPALQAALCDTCLLFGNTLQEEIEDYAQNGYGITSLTYQISYQDARVISFILDYETMAAHPDAEQHLLTLDINTGKPHDLRKEISAAGIQTLFKRYINRMRNSIPLIKKEIAENPEISADDRERIIEEVKEVITYIKPEDLLTNYAFTKTGITFNTFREMTYVYRGYDVEHEWHVNYATLQKYKLKTAVVIK